MGMHDDFLVQNYLGEDARVWATPTLQQQEVDARFPMVGADASLQHEQASGKPRRVDEAEKSMSNHTVRARKGCKCTLHSNLQHIANWHSL